MVEASDEATKSFGSELTLTYIRGCFLGAAALTYHRLIVILAGEEIRLTHTKSVRGLLCWAG